MIGFNGQYLSAAAIGDMRITAMSQGDKWLIAPWHVSASAATAIMSAFGAEGAGVIQATNAYLNGLATTDREKAQALAGFINEDPMLVCSIVETSKTRKITSLNNCRTYIDLYTATNLQIVGIFATTGDTGGTNDTACGSLKWNSSWAKCDVGSFICGFDKRSGMSFCYGTEHTWTNNIYANKVQTNTPYILDVNYSRFIAKSISGSTLITVNNSNYQWTEGNEQQMSMMGVGVVTYECKIYRDGELIRHIVPFNGKNGECLVDIVNGVSYSPSVENPQFTIALTDKP